MASWWFLLPKIPNSTNQNRLVVKLFSNHATDRFKPFANKIDRAFTLSNQLDSPHSSSIEPIDFLCVFAEETLDLADQLKQSTFNENGVIYIEVNRFNKGNRFKTPKHIFRLLHQYDFKEVGLYLVLPNFNRPKMYIPLFHPESLKWYFDQMFWKDTHLKVWFTRIIQALPSSFSSLINWIMPYFVITAIKDTTKNTNRFDLATQCEVDGSNSWPLILNNGIDEGNRTIAFIFPATESQPIELIKISSTVEMNHTTANEIKNRHDIQNQLGPLTNDIPTIINRFQYYGLEGYRETVAEGHLLSIVLSHAQLTKKQKFSLLQNVSNWLVQFKKQTTIKTIVWSDEIIQSLLIDKFDQFRQVFGPNKNVEALFERCLQEAQNLIGLTIPLYRIHFDFAPWNIYYDNGKLTVIDWEFDREHDDLLSGMPLYDLLYFITYWNHFTFQLYSNEQEHLGFKRLFLSQDRVDGLDQVDKIIKSHMDAIGIDTRFLPICLTYVWLEQSIYQHKRIEHLQTVRTSKPNLENRMVKYVHLLSDNLQDLWPTAPPKPLNDE